MERQAGTQEAQADGAQAQARQDPQGGAQAQQREPQGDPQGQQGGQGDQQQGQAQQEPQTVNRYKYERDIQRKDDEIADLKAKLDEARKAQGASGEGPTAAEVQAKLDALTAQLEAEKVNTRLVEAGCVNLKAASAVLGDYKDVADLKANCPYLFRAPQQQSTGGNPSGAPEAAPKTIREALSMRQKG